MRVLVTGGSGFVGRALLARLVADGTHAPRAAVRQHLPATAGLPDAIATGDIGARTDWSAALRGVDALVHTAARVHVMKDRARDPLAAYRDVNVAGTVALARSAARAGVRRFVFVSSVKVNGEATRPGRPFRPDDTPAPVDPYGISKHEAEQALHALAQAEGLEVVIVRPVLVYGPGVKANFRSMMRWLRRGVPLPFGAIHNRRSLVGLDNLVDLLMCCLTHPAAPNRTFFASDGDDLSTSELLRRTAAAMHTRARLFPVPVAILRTGARLVGRAQLAQRLLDSLQVDITTNRALLGWTPPVSVDEALARATREFVS